VIRPPGAEPWRAASYCDRPGSPGNDGGVTVGAGGTDRPVLRRAAAFRAEGLRVAVFRPAVFAAALRVPRLAAVFRVAVDAVDFRVVLFLLGARRPRFAALAAGAAGAGLLEPARWRSTFETWVSRLAS